MGGRSKVPVLSVPNGPGRPGFSEAGPGLSELSGI